MKRVIFIINSLKSRGGSERVAVNLANLLADKLNYQVTIINRDATKETAAYSLSLGVGVEVLSGNTLYFLLQVQKYLKENQPDYVIVHNMGRLSLLMSLLRKRCSKLISLEHVAFISRSWCVKKLTKILYKAFDMVLTLTDADKVSYKEFFEGKIVKISNISPFSLSPATTKLTSKVVIAVGRLTYQKNFQALLRAWKGVSHNLDGWELQIYGNGEDKDDLENLIESQQIERAYLMGDVSDMEAIYRQASLFVMSSRYEGLPMVLIEAQTFGLPIVSFNCPHGPAEIVVDHKNGLLVSNQDEMALGQAIKDVILTPGLLQTYSNQAKEAAKRFQEENVLLIWEKEILT